MAYEPAINRLWELREEKRELAEREKAIDEEYNELKKYLIANLCADQVNSLATNRARITLTKRTAAKLIPETGWDDFIEYVANTRSFHLLQKQAAGTACREQIIVMGEEIPGVELLELQDLSLTTLKTKL